MLEFEDMDVVLIRLITNDRVIGQILNADEDAFAMYAPMLVELKEVEGVMTMVLSPYDPLSSTVMAIFSQELLMTVTLPKDKLVAQYEDTWLAFYPSVADVRKKILEKKLPQAKEEQEYLDVDAINEMFKNIISGSLPINKKKMN